MPRGMGLSASRLDLSPPARHSMYSSRPPPNTSYPNESLAPAPSKVQNSSRPPPNTSSPNEDLAPLNTMGVVGCRPILAHPREMSPGPTTHPASAGHQPSQATPHTPLSPIQSTQSWPLPPPGIPPWHPSVGGVWTYYSTFSANNPSTPPQNRLKNQPTNHPPCHFFLIPPCTRNAPSPL